VPKGSPQAIEFGDGYGVHFPLAAIGQESVKGGPAVPRSRHAVIDVFRRDLEATRLSIRAQCMKLGFDVLLGRGDAGV